MSLPADAFLLTYQAVEKAVRPKQKITVSEWADANRILSTEGSSMPGKWKTSRTPFLREIMDNLSENSKDEKIVFMKSSQVGGTEAGSNWIGYIMDHAKGPAAIVMPTERSLNDWVSQKFDPMASDTPAIAEVLAKRSNKAADNNAQRKKFVGGILYFKTAGSTAELKSTSLRYALADEVDEWEWSTTQGDPLKLLDVRMSAFHDSKYFIVSTPTIKDASHIESEYEGGDQRRYFVPCPHCGELQFLKWNNLRFTRDLTNAKKITAVNYFCEHNGCVIEEHHKPAMLRELAHGGQARWIPQAPDNPYKSYHISTLYSDAMLGKSWLQLAYEWIGAQDDPKDLMVFVNTRLGESYRNATHDIKANVLLSRAEPYQLRTVPIGALILTAGVDVQDDRLEIQIMGHGRGDKTWPIDYHVIFGNPADEKIWDALVDYLKAKFTNHYGRELRIEATAIDTGGHHTHAVYNFVRKAAGLGIARCIAIKGASTTGRHILGKPSLQDVNWRGQSMKKGVALYTVGTDTAKHLIYNRLNGDSDKDPSERKMHFSTELPENYYEQLVSETFNPRKNRWEIKKGKHNEVLDTTVYSLAASHHPEIYLHKWKKSDWDRREAMLQPVDMVPNSQGAYQANKPTEIQETKKSVNINIGGNISLGNWKRGK
jgi:phage terminase large subunit GpA-like protein